MTGATARMMLGGRVTLRPITAARTLHNRNALLPGLSSLRAATLAPDSPPKWGFMSASRMRSTVMDQVHAGLTVIIATWKQCNAVQTVWHAAQCMSVAAIGRRHHALCAWQWWHRWHV